MPTTQRCAFCGQPIDKHTSDPHHRIKRAHGGQDTLENLARICTRCHRLTHVGEKLIARGKSNEFILDYYRSVLINHEGVDALRTANTLLEAAAQAALVVHSTDRKFIPVEVKMPTQMHTDLTKKAADLHISKQDLILWALQELLGGRVLLPR